jgi:Putative Ig domain
MNGTDLFGFDFKAWDRTSGANGDLGDSNGGATGAFSRDGSFNSGVDTVRVTINPVNGAPTATNLNAAEIYTEDTPLNLTDIVVADVDSATVTATLTLSNPAVGSLSTGTSGAVTSVYNAGTGVWTASGAVSNVNALLADVSFIPTNNANGSFTIGTSVSDGVLSVSGSKAMTGTPVNDAPTATNLNAAETYTEDTPLNLTDIVVSDVDNATVTATLTLSNPAAGSLSTGTSGAVASVYNAGTGIWTASGALVDVNRLLAGVRFVPASNVNMNVTITTNVSDGVSSVTGSKVMTGISVNDAPVLTPIGNKTVNEVTLLQFTVNAGDVDGPSQNLSYSTSRLPKGATFDLTTRTFSWTPTESQGPGTYTVTFRVTDGVVTTSETIAITVSEVNVAPVLATIANQVVSPGGTLRFKANGSDRDVPKQVLVYSLAPVAGESYPTGIVINASTGTVTWSTSNTQPLGQYKVAVSLSDGVLSVTQIVTITVT